MELLKQQAKENLSKLVKKFEAEMASGEAYEYNEEATKMAFIEPLLKDVLGWDVNNHNEVCPEHKVSHKRVDYSLKIDGKDQLFIEAKSVKEDLENHIEQAVKYGYNRKDVSFVILTDFEGLMLFDVTIKPDKRNPKKGLKLKLTWQEYETKFDKLWLLSRGSVISGELNNLLREKPKNQQPVDKAILKDLENWREALAKDLYKNNHHLFKTDDINRDADYLKEITQRILDRIIFMRFAEDRQLTHRPRLNTIFEDRVENIGTKAMIFLKDEFKHYDRTFNSDLFAPKDWEQNLAIDFKIMKQIIEETYNPYEFDVIPLEVLGNIYEQYLGYTIRLTEQQVKFELKPDVRKAGGVYYTPEYIVDYIVKNTVGKMLNEFSPAKAKKITILDPACGSGSFLIRAYSEMLNWYSKQKKEKIKKSNSLSFPQAVSGNPQNAVDGELALNDESSSRSLSIYEKAEILRTHIFGVDIDAQAVEVTKLSLMFKMLEGEYGIIPGRAVLPMLDKNIRCGNSLISGSTFELQSYFDDDYYKINAFNWEDRFSAVMSNGGFDVVIGNPPWGSSLTEQEKKYLVYRYCNKRGEAESHLYFIEKGTALINKSGVLGVITPNSWLFVKNSAEIRDYLIQNFKIKELIELSKYIFKDAPDIVPILIFICKRANAKNECIVKTSTEVKIDQYNFNSVFSTNLIDQSIWLKHPDRVFNLRLTPKVVDILNKCRMKSEQLGCICEVIYGIKTGNNEKYLSNKATNIYDKKALKTGEISRYNISWKGLYINWTSALAGYRKTSIEIPKIVVQYIRKLSMPRRIISALDENGNYYPLNNYSYIQQRDKSISLKYILGIINSTLINYYFANTFIDYNIKPFYLQQLPIRTINIDKINENETCDKIILLVTNLIDLKKIFQLAQSNTKEQIKQQISQTDREIDELVYKLYGLTKEEINIIQGN